MKKVEFFQTTKGYLAKVNGFIVWFIRDEPCINLSDSWFVYKREYGGLGLKLIPAIALRNEKGDLICGTKWGFDCLESAKAFIYQEEIGGKENESC